MIVKETLCGIKFSTIDITSQITSTVNVFVSAGIAGKLAKKTVMLTLYTLTSATFVVEKVRIVPEIVKKE